MRKILILIIFIIQFSNLYADAGLAFRYKVEIQKKNKENITGYVYHYTYSEGYNDLDESFCDYFTRDFNNKPYLYIEVKSLELSDNLKLDFSLIENIIEFDFEDIENIKLLEEEAFFVGDKIFTIENHVVYNLIGNTSFIEEEIYFSWSENCSTKLIDFAKKGNLSKIKERIKKSFEMNFDKEGILLNEKFWDLYYKEKDSLLNEKILLLQYCDAL